MKFPVVNRPEYIIYLELYMNLYWLHTDVFKWSASIKKNFIKELNKLQSLLNAPIYALVDNDKLKKFGNTIGFKYFANVVGNNNTYYQVFNRSL